MHSRYDFDDIRRFVSSERVAILYGGCRVSSTHRCAALWRHGDNPESVQFNDDGTFHDFKTGDHGGPVALLALIKNVDMQEAAEELGDRFCPQLARNAVARITPVQNSQQTPPPPKPATTRVMTITEPVLAKPIEVSGADSVTIMEMPVAPPPAASRYDQLMAEGWKVVREYTYTDVNGRWCYTVMRLEKDGEKTFLQKSPDGWGLKGVRRILYNLPEVAKASEVWVVEGEKDVETLRSCNIVATTNSGGAEHWDDSFSSDLKGKDIVVFADNDEKGRAHAMTVARSVYPVARSVKVVCPSKDEKGDVTDFLQYAKHTIHDLLDIVKATPFWTVERPGVITDEMIAEAKELNKRPFRNFRVVEGDGPNAKPIIEPIQVKSLLMEFYRRFLQFPCCLGRDVLFDHDKDTRKIETFTNDKSLFVWISRKSGQNCEWMNSSQKGYISKEEFFNGVKQTTKRFEMISNVPNYPEQSDVYYTCPQLPEPSENHMCFRRLCDFFFSSKEWHKPMIRTLFAAPLWYRPMFGRPSWIIDSSEGKGVGKTTLIEMLSKLYMCEPLDVSPEQLFKHYEEIIKRLVSEGGRRTRIVLLDNLTVNLSCGQFASLITKSSITGRAPYSSGEDTRPNNLTYCITCNSAQVDDDLVSRSFFVSLRRPPADVEWKDNILKYIEENRWQIFADIIDLIRTHVPFLTPPKTRYSEFEKEVLQPMCGNEETYLKVIENLQQAKEAANTEQDIANQLADGIRWKIGELNSFMRPDEKYCWIQSDVFKEWTREILGTSLSAPTARNYARNGLTKNFDPLLERFPTSKYDRFRRSGIMWIGDNVQDMSTADIIGMRGKRIMVIDQRPYRKEDDK